MVYTGSVGLHRVVRELRKKKYANSPMNDMRVIEVPPLTKERGVHLAKLLIEGEGLACADELDRIAEEISNCVGHVPFYIHTLVANLVSGDVALTRKIVQDKIAALIVDPNDPADFKNYRSRLFSYYDGREREIVFALLDEVAFSSHPLSPSALITGVVQKLGGVSGDVVREVVDSLERDHYLYREPASGTFAFRYELVLRWWKSERA
jgi:uncharacterized protein